MIKTTWIRILIVVITGGATYGLTFASGLYTEWSQVISLVNTAIVLTCGILTGFPKKTE